MFKEYEYRRNYQMEFLLVGTIHFGETPDVVSFTDEDKRLIKQQDIEKLIETLAQYAPDQIFVEYPFSMQDQLTKLYIAEDASDPFKQNEIYQIAFQLAKKLKHPTVYAVDWNEDIPGLASLDDVAAGPCAAEFSEIMKVANNQFEIMTTALRNGSLIELYEKINTDEFNQANHNIYLQLMQLSDEQAFNWTVNYWYYRNLKIAQNICKALTPESKRAVILIGSGHNYLVKQQLQEYESFKVTNFADFLALNPVITK